MEHKDIGSDLHKASFHGVRPRRRRDRLWEAVFPRTAHGLAAFGAHEMIDAQ